MKTLEIGSIRVELIQKLIKNLHITVLPPNGWVRVSAPIAMSETAIRMAIITRIPWIKRQISAFENQSRQSKRALISGESHYLWGRHYRLEVVLTNDKNCVKLQGQRLILSVKESVPNEKKEQLLKEFYRHELKQKIEALLPKWEKVIGVKVQEWGVKKMKTIWGSCNIQAQRIWLNLELAKKPPECLEYVLVHELVHLLERHHNQRFHGLMTQFLPNWQERKNLLNKQPISEST